MFQTTNQSRNVVPIKSHMRLGFHLKITAINSLASKLGMVSCYPCCAAQQNLTGAFYAGNFRE